MPDSLASTPPTPPAGVGAQKRKAEDTLEADTVTRGGHRTVLATRGAVEYSWIWLLRQRRLRAVSGLTGACAACSHCWAAAWELSCLDHSHAATPLRVTRASRAQLLRSVLGATCR